MLIGLHGRKQAGKDTTYERMAALYGPPLCIVERASFADLLYRSAAAALGVGVEDLYAWKVEPRVRIVIERDVSSEGDFAEEMQSLNFREYLQRFGTEAHREIFGDNFWVDQLNLDHADKIMVVTDVRFPNEAEHISHLGGHVVQVLGPASIETAGDTHASEKPLPSVLIDECISNDIRDDGFRHLDAQIQALMTRLIREGGLK